MTRCMPCCFPAGVRSRVPTSSPTGRAWHGELGRVGVTLKQFGASGRTAFDGEGFDELGHHGPVPCAGPRACNRR